MKWPALFFCAFLPFAAIADDAPKPPPLKPLLPPNVTVIDGKKFYSLGNARRFTGSVDSPKAQSVVHFPRAEGTITGRTGTGLARGTRLPMAATDSGMPLPSSDRVPGGAPQSPETKDKVLSIFAPEDKAAATK